MTGAVEETAFDESVFDASDDAPAAEPAKVEAKAEPEPEPDEPKPADPKSKLEAVAKKIGHAPKDEWKGDPADWLEPAEFILKAAGEVLPSMRKSLEDAKEEIKGLKAAVKTSIKHIGKARQEGYEQRSRELQAELAQYAAAGDVDNVKSVTADIVALEKEVREEPAAEPDAPDEPDWFVAWKAENDWWGKDRIMTAAAAAAANEAEAEGYNDKALAKEVNRRIREAFPHKFEKPENPNRRLPGSVEAPNAAPRSRGKTFSDMPKEHQDMCLDLMKQSKAITKENYAREFFAEEPK
jgi:hypothetical protein